MFFLCLYDGFGEWGGGGGGGFLYDGFGEGGGGGVWWVGGVFLIKKIKTFPLFSIKHSKCFIKIPPHSSVVDVITSPQTLLVSKSYEWSRY